jgi:hypothetical protein
MGPERRSMAYRSLIRNNNKKTISSMYAHMPGFGRRLQLELLWGHHRIMNVTNRVAAFFQNQADMNKCAYILRTLIIFRMLAI